MNNERKKVAVITYIPTPYRIPFFELMNKSSTIDCHVYYFARTEGNRMWKLPSNVKYPYTYLKGYSFAWKKKDDDLFTLHINISIVRAILRNNYDCIICAGYNSLTALLALVTSKIKRVPFVHWSEQTIPAEPPKKFIAGLIRKTLKYVFCKYSDAHIASSSYTKEFLIKNGVEDKKIFISPYTTDLERYHKEFVKYNSQKIVLKTAFGIVETTVILYIGQLIDRKGIRELLTANELLTHEQREATAIIIAGDGPLNQLVKDSVKQYKNIKFIGYQQQNELMKYMAISDIFVLPSKYDTWGMVVNEAMACGLPVITTKGVGASGDLVINGTNGFVVDIDDPDALAAAFQRMIENTELRESMGRKSLEIIKGWNLEEAVKGFEKSVCAVIE